MKKQDVLKVCRQLALASAKPGFDPAEIRRLESEISDEGWKFECLGTRLFAATADDGDSWVIRVPAKGRSKAVAFTAQDYALYEHAGNLVLGASDCATQAQVDSLTVEFSKVCAQISAKSLVTELEEGMAQAVSSLELRPFDAFTFARFHHLEYKNSGLNEWISGETKPFKDDLKAQGFKWAAKRKAWYRKAA